MDKKVLKKDLLEKCQQLQLAKIGHLENEMAEAQKSANDYGQQSDVFDSHRMQMIGKRDMYVTQLQKEMEILETLKRIDLSINHNKVEFGAVIITDLQKVFISVGLGKLMVENNTFYAISLKVPFYQAMQGLKKGDTFDFRGKKISILGIY